MQEMQVPKIASPQNEDDHLVQYGDVTKAFAELERSVFTALETYSNVHRGNGHFSIVSTQLFEQARTIVLEYLGLSKHKYHIIFCTPGGAYLLKSKLKPENYKCISSQDIGLPIGVRAMAVIKKKLPEGTPFIKGGGTTKIISPEWIVWARPPDKFEAGTPSIMNIITFARALQITSRLGKDIFRKTVNEKLSVQDILYRDGMESLSGKELLNELRNTMAGRDYPVPTAEGEKSFINLDNGASTPSFLPVWNTVCKTLCQPIQIQNEIRNEVRNICSGALNAPLSDYDVIFTSNTTESINLAAGNINFGFEAENEPVVLNSILEHSSNDLPWRLLEKFSILRIGVDSEGFVDPYELDSLLADYNRKGHHGNKRIVLMAITGASNVLGTYNNLAEISRIVHNYGAKLLVDAAQMVAHRKIDIDLWGIDFLAFSAHKAYAPFGCGVLISRKGLLNLSSAENEIIRNSGEENTVGISALGKSLILLQRVGMDIITKEEQALTRKLLNGLSQIKEITVYGIKDPDSKNFANKGGVVVFTMKNMMSDRVAEELAVRGGIGIRNGCHCAHIIVKHILGVGPGLERFQRIIATLFPRLNFPGVARVSLGIENTEEDIDTLIEVLGKIITNTPESRVAKQQINYFVNASVMKVYPQI